MAKRSHNYTIAVRHKPKVIVPILEIELPGKLFVLLLIVYLIISTLLFTLILSLLKFKLVTRIIIALIISLASVLVFLTFKDDYDGEEGSNFFKILYFKHFKKYRIIVNQEGNRFFLPGKTKGVIVCIKE